MFVFRLLCVMLACITIGLAYQEKVVSKLPAGYIHYSDIETAYKIYDNRVNWNHAREACQSEYARLAVIDSPEKLEYVTSMRPFFAWVWVGISRNSLRGSWHDIEGDRVSPNVPWAFLNPKPSGDCVAVSGFFPGLGNWSCARRKLYVCEITDASQTEELSFDVRSIK